MIANLKAMKVTVENRDNGKLFILDIETENGKLPSLYMRENIFEHMLDSMRDMPYDRYPVYDGTYTHFYPLSMKMVEFHNYGSEYKRFSKTNRDGEYTEHYIDFPFHCIVEWFESIAMIKDDCVEYLPDNIIQELTRQFAPITNVVYHCEVPQDDKSFDNCIQSRLAIANNYSHGQLVEVHIQKDFGQDFGFYILNTEDNQIILNGGIIYHANDNQYHTHT